MLTIKIKISITLIYLTMMILMMLQLSHYLNNKFQIKNNQVNFIIF